MFYFCVEIYVTNKNIASTKIYSVEAIVYNLSKSGAHELKFIYGAY